MNNLCGVISQTGIGLMVIFDAGNTSVKERSRNCRKKPDSSELEAKNQDIGEFRNELR